MIGNALLPLLEISPEFSRLAALMLAVAIALPLLLALAMLLRPVRRIMPHLLFLAPVPALVAALAVPRGMTMLVAPDPFRFILALDTPGALLLGGAALLWMMAGAFAAAYLRKDPARSAFAVWWLLAMAGSFAVFLVADVVSFYLAYALASFSAFGLVTHDDTPGARRAGNLYLALTVLGEGFLIAAFVMLASGMPDANPLIRDAVAALPASPVQGLIIALLLLGFTMKMGLFPLHVWMPLAHSVAPVPGSAVLSGVVVKAGVIGLLRFLPEGVPLPGWGMVLCVFGLFTAFYGVAIGFTQKHPKRALAYSTVSQMGFVGAIFGAGIMAGRMDAFSFTAFYAMNHMLLKGAMFLAVGLALASGMRRRALGTLIAIVLGLSLAGLPFTGGALAKYAAKMLLPGGMIEFLIALSAAGTTLLMARYAVLVAKSDVAGAPQRGLLLPACALTVLALVVPYILFSPVTGLPLSAAFTSDALLKGSWPVLLGLVLFAALRLSRLSARLPEVPAGDLWLVVSRLERPVRAMQAQAVTVDGYLRQWPVAGFALLGLTALLAAVAWAA